MMRERWQNLSQRERVLVSLIAIIVGILSVWRVQDQIFNIKMILNKIHDQQVNNQ